MLTLHINNNYSYFLLSFTSQGSPEYSGLFSSNDLVSRCRCLCSMLFVCVCACLFPWLFYLHKIASSCMMLGESVRASNEYF